MDDAHYSNRELDQFFKANDAHAEALHQTLMQRMDVFESNTSTALMEIKQQTTKTNGSVASLKLWRAYLTGGMAVLTVLVIPILIAFIDSGKIL
jgi:hypothetical protein